MSASTQTARVLILLVEDDPGDVELVQEALQADRPAMGLQVDLSVVNNGVDAIAYLRRQGAFANAQLPHLILLDLNLPRRDGRSVLSEIKRDHQLKNIPVIVFTTSDAEEDIAQSYDLGANCYVLKSSSLEAFMGTVQTTVQFWAKAAQLPDF